MPFRLLVGESLAGDPGNRLAGALRIVNAECRALIVPEIELAEIHIKPWALCEADPERLDVYNGLLLAAHLMRRSTSA